MERATGRQKDQRRWLPDDAVEPSVASAVDAGQRCEQPSGVWVARIVEDIVDAPQLDLATGVHHEHPVRRAGDDSEIVRDEKDGGARAVLDPLEHFQHLGLDGDVERGRRLVGDEHSGSLAMDMAIITRWRIPPENSCGY